MNLNDFKRIISFLWEVGKVAIIALAIVVPIRAFVFQPFIVRGVSMEPNFHSGDYLIIEEISYRFRNPERFEVVVFKLPQTPSQRYIKRIIGLPGETLDFKEGKIFVSSPEFLGFKVLDETFYLGQESGISSPLRITLKDNEYFVLGDKRSLSYDSRVWGGVSQENFIGRVWLRLFSLPPTFGKIITPN